MLFREIADKPLAAADRLEALASKFLAFARTLRNQGGTRDTNGIGDRATINVVGPGGEITQRGGT